MPVEGRTAELEVLHNYVDAGRPLIILWGGRGVGKTELARSFFATESKGLKFAVSIAISGFLANAAKLLSDIADALEVTPHISSFEVLVDSIMEALRSRPTLLLLDNVEPDSLDEVPLQDWFRLLSATEIESTVVVTTRKRYDDVTGPGLGALLNVTGLRDDQAAVRILGESLRTRFPDSALLDACRRLDNVPQSLIYLRWANPATLEELSRTAETLAKQPYPSLSTAALRTTLLEAGQSALSFCGALGRLRATQFRVEFLRSFWESLDLPDNFDTIINDVCSRRVLLPLGETEFRIHPDVHADLGRLASEDGLEWLRRVHRAAVQCYGDDRADHSALVEWVYHQFELGEFRKAFKNTISPSYIEEVQCTGRSLSFRPILEAFRTRATHHLHPLDYAYVLIALGSINGDLSRHVDALECLENALRVIQDSDNDRAQSLRVQATMLKAISLGDLGETSLCIDSYLGVLSMDPEAKDPRTALCMGYVGYVFCDLQDFVKADKYTRASLELAPPDADTLIHAKNLSNRGLYYYFTGDTQAAESHLQRGLTMTSGDGPGFRDLRETGRMLSHLALCQLGSKNPDVDTIERNLARSIEITTAVGDIRRAGLATGRLGLLEYIRGNTSSAKALLESAIQTHLRVDDKRNLIFETLFLCGVAQADERIPLSDNVKDFVSTSLRSRHIDKRFADRIIAALSHENYRHLLSFWFNCQRPYFFPRSQP